MKIVYIASVFPYPPNSGHRIRNYNLLRNLGRTNDLHLFILGEEAPAPEDMNALGSFCKSIRWFQEEESRAFKNPLQAVFYMLRGMPPEYRLTFSPEMWKSLGQFLSRNPVDVIQIEDPNMAQYIEAVPRNMRVVKAITFHDVNFKKYARIAQLETKFKRKVRMKLHSFFLNRWEAQYAARFDVCLMMSEIDAQLLRSKNAALNTIVIPNGVDTKSLMYQPKTDLSTGGEIVYVGNMDYRPNIDAVVFFCREVMPLLLQEMPEVHFSIVGINPRDEVLALQSEHVTVTGRVESVGPYYRQADICVVPLRAGGGTRLKILESFALGCPVVSTSIGAEGLDVVDGTHLLLADDAVSFAKAVLAVMNQPLLREKLVKAGRQLVEERYDWEQIAGNLNAIYSKMVGAVSKT